MSVTSVFVDASAWVAFFNRRDAHQAEARETIELLLRTSAPLITSTWTTYEAITIVRSKLGYGRARRLWQMANNRRIVTMIRVDPTIESAALKLFWRYRDKEWGVVDCAGIVLMERIGCKTAFGYDRISSKPAVSAASRCCEVPVGRCSVPVPKGCGAKEKLARRFELLTC